MPNHESVAATLRQQVTGAVILPADATYDAARRVHNGLIDRRPAIIVQCRGTADVQAAVRAAREHGLEIAVRGGGHNVAGNAVCDGGLVIDLSLMRGVQVDPKARRRARARAARPGATTTARRSSTASPPPAASCRPPASAGSRSAAAWAG